MPDSPVTLLRVHAGYAPWNARGLAAHATALVDSAGMRPTNASARAQPSPRAIRFYVSTGLMDRPDGTGTAATYHYKHLLQLLAIKIRQREGHTLEAIKAELADATGDALERRVAQALAAALGRGADKVQSHDEEEPGRWRRVPVADGVELHVRDDTPLARSDSVAAMREGVRAAISRIG